MGLFPLCGHFSLWAFFPVGSFPCGHFSLWAFFLWAFFVGIFPVGFFSCGHISGHRMELCKVDAWLKANRLSLNIDKTFYMIITHNNYDETDINIGIRDVQLSRVMSTKFLGVTIDRLSHGGHLSALYKQLSRVRGIFYRLSSFLPPHVIKMLHILSVPLAHGLWYLGLGGGGGGGRVCNQYFYRIRKVNSSTLNIFSDKLPPNSPHPLSFDDTVYSAWPSFIDFRAARVEWNIFTIKSIV